MASAEPGTPGWWEIDLDVLDQADGAYVYEFILDSHTDTPVSNPYADEITCFGGYSGKIRNSAGQWLGQACGITG